VNPADEIISVYGRHAHAWASARAQQRAEEKWLSRFLQLVESNAEVLDVGCGPGVPIARYLVEHGHSVHGIDASPEMLTLFRQNLPSSHATLADMRDVHLGRTFGGLLAWDSFFHLTAVDQRPMFATFREHSRPGTALMFTSGPASGEAIGNLEGEPLYHASLDGDEYRELLCDHGFVVVDYVAEDPECGGHTVWLAQFA
jgi:2-polyprenyl-3-methyl-5-hydroxy-6-metoxy-1,4-benzoquinol methylase